MRFQNQYGPIIPKYSYWNKWFAWYPVTIAGKFVWLEIVWRKGNMYSCEFGSVTDWEYKFLEEV
jgi:hypothetical protein